MGLRESGELHRPSDKTDRRAAEDAEDTQRKPDLVARSLRSDIDTSLGVIATRVLSGRVGHCSLAEPQEKQRRLPARTLFTVRATKENTIYSC